MGKKHQKAEASNRDHPLGAAPSRRLRLWSGIAIFLAGWLATVAAGMAAKRFDLHQSDFQSANKIPQSLSQLLALSPGQLTNIDVGRMNLLCADGLPGAENVNVSECLATLDRWAQAVREDTERHLYRAHDPRFADHYHNSETYLRCEFLLQTLQTRFGVDYNPALIDKSTHRSLEFPFTDSRDFMIHGLLTGKHTGSCSSLPVLYVAVGRRLGYPLKLVTAADHVFFRWEDGEEKWNVESSVQNGGYGMISPSDDYWKLKPDRSGPVSESQIRSAGWLKSLSPTEELGMFMAVRGDCFTDTHRFADAQIAFAYAHKSAPAVATYSLQLQEAMKQELGGIPQQASHSRQSPPNSIDDYRPENPLAQLDRINAINEANRQRQEEMMSKAFNQNGNVGGLSPPNARINNPGANRP